MQKPTYQVLCGSLEAPSLVLIKFSIDSTDHDFDGAYNELQQAMKGHADPLWGYFPQHPDQKFVNETPLKKCRQLGLSLRKKVFEQYNAFTDLDLAFIRLCLRDIRGTEHGGFHVDLDPGSAFIGDSLNDGTRNICRLLLNLHPTEPRELKYLSNSLAKLASIGLEYTRHSYKGVPTKDLPAGSKIESVFVPPRESTTLYGVTFWSNLVPHTGVDHAHGHFVAGYGGFRSQEALLI